MNSAQEREYAAKSIWGLDGPPHAIDQGIKDAIKAKGKPLREKGFHTKNYLEGYEQGRIDYKAEVIDKLLKGEKVDGKDLSETEIDELLDRPSKTSPGGIILKA